MEFKTPGHAKDVAAFRAQFERVAPDLGCDAENLGAEGPLGLPLEVLGKTLTNRFAIHPMEGWDGTREGEPGDWTRRRWRRFGQSGADLVWGGEAVAVQEDGRANPNQLFVSGDRDPRPWLEELRREVEEGRRDSGRVPGGALLGLQLTHSGRFARPDGEPAPRIPSHHPVLDPRFAPGAAPLTDGELEAIGESFVRAAVAAKDAGYDFVDVKCCHGYLLHELLGARSRPGPYGGSFENRTRLFRRIVEAIHSEAPDLGVGVRLSLLDVFPHSKGEDGVGAPLGWEEHVPLENGFGIDSREPWRSDFEEPLAFLDLVHSLGLRLVNVTLGSPYYCPHLQRPAAYPPSDGYLPPEDPLAGVAAHLRAVRRARAAHPDLILVGTGYSYLQEWLVQVGQREVGAGHVDFVGLGRMVLSYPELPLDALARRPLQRKLVCRTFSDCTTAPRHGLPSGCYPLDRDYRERPEFEDLKRLKETLRKARP